MEEEERGSRRARSKRKREFQLPFPAVQSYHTIQYLSLSLCSLSLSLSRFYLALAFPPAHPDVVHYTIATTAPVGRPWLLITITLALLTPPRVARSESAGSSSSGTGWHCEG